MNLLSIETVVLQNVGYDRYSSLSVDTDTEKAEDFALLHTCVLLAREEIKLNTLIPGILKEQEIITTAATQSYSLNDDFDIPVIVIYATSGGEFELSQVYPKNLLQKLGSSKTTTEGTPSWYMIFGNTGDLIQMRLYNIPNKSDETVTVMYKPILPFLETFSDEDVIMNKYGYVVAKLTTAYYFQLIKKDEANFTKWYDFGALDFSKIDFREQTSDSNRKELPNSVLRNRRMRRFSK